MTHRTNRPSAHQRQRHTPPPSSVPQPPVKNAVQNEKTNYTRQTDHIRPPYHYLEIFGGEQIPQLYYLRGPDNAFSVRSARPGS